MELTRRAFARLLALVAPAGALAALRTGATRTAVSGDVGVLECDGNELEPLSGRQLEDARRIQQDIADSIRRIGEHRLQVPGPEWAREYPATRTGRTMVVSDERAVRDAFFADLSKKRAPDAQPRCWLCNEPTTGPEARQRPCHRVETLPTSLGVAQPSGQERGAGAPEDGGTPEPARRAAQAEVTQTPLGAVRVVADPNWPSGFIFYSTA